MPKGARLECTNVSKLFGEFRALSDVNLIIEPGELIGIVGPNGAGKTTLFNVVTNVGYQLTSGTVKLDGRRIDKLRTHQITQLGIARTFQIPAYFSSLTCVESVKLASWLTAKSKSTAFGDEAKSILGSVGLGDKVDLAPRKVSLFDLKRLMIANALATNPKVLLLDEPFGGLSPTEIKSIIELARKVNDDGCTVAVIEHKIRFLVELVERLMVLSAGQKIAEGDPREVVDTPIVKKVYLGESY